MISKNTWIRPVLFTLLCFGILLSLRLIWLYFFYPPSQAVAVNGHVIVNSENINEDELVYLQGEWIVEDIEKEMLSTNDNTLLTLEKAHAKLNLTFDSPLKSNELMLYIPNNPYSMTVILNGEKVEGTKKQYGNSYSEYTIPFIAHSESISLEIIAEGEALRFPFTNKAVVLSSQEGLTNQLNLNIFLKVAIVMTLIMNMIYSFIVYFFLERSKVVLFYAGAYFFLSLELVYKLIFPYVDWIGFSFTVNAKLKILVFYATALCIIFMGRAILKPIKLRYLNAILCIYIVAFILIFIVPVQLTNYYHFTLLALHIISGAYVYSVVFRTSNYSSREISFLLFAFSGAISGILWGGLKGQFYFEIPAYPFDYLAFELGIAAFWFYRYYLNNQKVIYFMEELKLSDQMKEEFLQSSSERLYNPLNKLMMIIEELTRTRQHKSNERHIQELKNVTKGMHFTLSDVIDYTRLKAGKISCEKKPVNVQATLYHIRDLLYHILHINKIDIIFDIPNRLPFVYADEKRLSQVFFNLLQHSLSSTVSGIIKVKCSVQQNRLIVEMMDVSLYQESSDENFKDEKTLSLDVCRQLIELQGGQLTIDSSGIVIELSASDYFYLGDSQAETQILRPKKLPKASILIVTERIEDIDMIQAVLASEPYFIQIAKSENELNQLLTQKQWDLVIIDSILSYSSGHRLIELIRQQFTLVELPILYVTVNSNALETTSCFTVGANDYITKPIQPLELKNRVQALITMEQMVKNRLQLEASLLQAQIHPHFLFNTLNTISSLSELDPEKMVRLLNEFGDYLYSSFNKRMMKRLVPLQNELQVVQSYVYIEQQRFEPLLKVKWEIEEVYPIMVPPFSIQTLVENAIHHGVLKNGDGGTVVIQVTKKEHTVHIVIKDDGVGIEKDKLEQLFEQSDQQGIGLYNTHERLRRAFGTGLQIESKVGKGTAVTICVPLDLRTSVHEEAFTYQ